MSAEDKKLSGGIENYRSKQGFYVYRNERLIVWGTWFGRHRDELTKYARIRVDIPNTLDDIWGIDIKKQNVFAGGSGPGTSAAVLLSYIKKEMENNKLNRVLLCATGALMNPTMINQKNSIPCIAHVIELRREI